MREESEACRARFCLMAMGWGRDGSEMGRGAGADLAEEIDATSSSCVGAGEVNGGKEGDEGESKPKASSAMAEVRSSRLRTIWWPR